MAKCRRCGESFYQRMGQSRYCEDCQQFRVRERAKRYRDRTANARGLSSTTIGEHIPDRTLAALESNVRRDAIMAILTSCIVLSTTCITRAANTDNILDAIQRVETGGHRNPSQAVGDGGRSIGPLQIQRAYWQDSGVAGRYEQVRDEAYARRVVIAYAKRYEPAALRRGDAETLARLHNAGPGWRGKRRATDGYWKRVKGAMR